VKPGDRVRNKRTGETMRVAAPSPSGERIVYKVLRSRTESMAACDVELLEACTMREARTVAELVTRIGEGDAVEWARRWLEVHSEDRE